MTLSIENRKKEYRAVRVSKFRTARAEKEKLQMLILMEIVCAPLERS